MPDEPDALEHAVGPDRRKFMRSLIGTAFAVPVVSSFTMSGFDAVFGGVSGATTAMANSNTAGPMYPDARGCVQVAPNGGNRNFVINGGGFPVTINVPNFTFPNSRQVCLFRGNLTALQSTLPPDHIAKSAFAVVFQFGDAAFPITLTVPDPAVAPGDVVFRVDQGTQTYPGTVGTSTWSLTFTEDPSFVIATPPAAPPAPPNPGTPTTPGAPGTPAPGGASGDTGAAPATPVDADPRFTG